MQHGQNARGLRGSFLTQICQRGQKKNSTQLAPTTVPTAQAKPAENNPSPKTTVPETVEIAETPVEEAAPPVKPEPEIQPEPELETLPEPPAEPEETEIAPTLNEEPPQEEPPIHEPPSYLAAEEEYLPEPPVVENSTEGIEEETQEEITPAVDLAPAEPLRETLGVPQEAANKPEQAEQIILTELNDETWGYLLTEIEENCHPSLLSLLRGAIPLSYNKKKLIIGNNNPALFNEEKTAQVLEAAQKIFDPDAKLEIRETSSSEKSLIVKERDEKIEQIAEQKQSAKNDPQIKALQDLFEGSKIYDIKIKGEEDV